MADNNLYNLRFAGYESLAYQSQQKSVLPSQLFLSNETLAIINTTLPQFAFTKEYEVSYLCLYRY
jgi:hypothetical protein